VTSPGRREEVVSRRLELFLSSRVGFAHFDVDLVVVGHRLPQVLLILELAEAVSELGLDQVHLVAHLVVELFLLHLGAVALHLGVQVRITHRLVHFVEDLKELWLLPGLRSGHSQLLVLRDTFALPRLQDFLLARSEGR